MSSSSFCAPLMGLRSEPTGQADLWRRGRRQGLNGLSRECKPLEEITNGHSTHKPVMNGLIISHNVKDHNNGSAPLRSLPISALKQNGLLQTLAAGGDQPNPAEENVELEKARQEWEALENVQPALTEDSNPTPIISFNEALQYFQTTDLGDLLKNIQPTIRRTGLAAITHFLFGPPRLHRELLEERDLVFAIAQCECVCVCVCVCVCWCLLGLFV
ncbi:RNA-binding motif and ELMO domain-containing protein 1 [Collichthys lucidus]|uniref:RNA-binding motif and ELMO domain-containing protein 1 n=1 Tax=Collichthys lucidus TaxID=240159 RepID=A0A4U5UUX1_COLLU|nr:RNA-binding motif and ELMO domain-containing protein 1 [Collichthys lucidus]